MGLSTRQVSSDELDWGDQNFLQSGGLELPKPPPTRRQSQNQQLDPLPCPRCGSKNTKFCYYNNYNKSQPRHFCKACKRHWTKGGTLRNVPVGGGRKNKRLKTAAAAATTTSGNVKSSTAGINNPIMGNQSHHQTQSLSLALGDQKDIFGILSQASINNRGNNVNCNFLCPSTTLPLIQNQMPPFTFSTLSSLESNPSSISPPFQFLNGDNLVGLASMEDTITLMPSTSTFVSQTWQAPLTSSGMEVPNYWNWDEVDPLVSTDQLNIPWDDTEVKP